jgi:hypothetical protein
MSAAAIAKEVFRVRRKYIPGEPPQEIERATTRVLHTTGKMLDFPGTPGCGRAIHGAHAPEKPLSHSRRAS